MDEKVCNVTPEPPPSAPDAPWAVDPAAYRHGRLYLQIAAAYLIVVDLLVTAGYAWRMGFGRIQQQTMRFALMCVLLAFLLIDARTPDAGGQVPQEDVIGGVQVKGGEPVPDSYRANPHHRLLTARGFFQLGEELHACLRGEVDALMDGR